MRKKSSYIFGVIFIVVLLILCNSLFTGSYNIYLFRGKSCLDNVINSGLQYLRFVDEFQTFIYPHKVYHSLLRGDRYNTAVWDSQTILYGRYKVTLQCPIVYDFFHCNQPIIDGPVLVHIWEINTIDVENGTISVTYSSGWKIADDDWVKFRESNYDWNSIGVSIKKSEPISNIEELEKYVYRGIKDK